MTAIFHTVPAGRGIDVGCGEDPITPDCLQWNLPLELPREVDGRGNVWHQFVVRHPERDRLRRELASAGISTGLHYRTPVHLQPAYRHLGYEEGEFPRSERLGRESLSLPLYPELSFDQQDIVAEAVRSALGPTMTRRNRIFTVTRHTL